MIDKAIEFIWWALVALMIVLIIMGGYYAVQNGREYRAECEKQGGKPMYNGRMLECWK